MNTNPAIPKRCGGKLVRLSLSNASAYVDLLQARPEPTQASQLPSRLLALSVNIRPPKLSRSSNGVSLLHKDEEYYLKKFLGVGFKKVILRLATKLFERSAERQKHECLN